MLHNFRTKTSYSVITPVVTGSQMIKIHPLQLQAKVWPLPKPPSQSVFVLFEKAEITAKVEVFVYDLI